MKIRATILAAALTLTLPGIAAAEPPWPEPIAVDGAGNSLPGGASFDAVSDDGSRVAFQTQESDGGDHVDAAFYVRDRDRGTTRKLDGVDAWGPDITTALSGNGRYAAWATYLYDVAEDDPDYESFRVHDLENGDVQDLEDVVDVETLRSLAFSDDGSKLAALVAAPSGGSRIEVIDLDSEEVVERTDAGSYGSFALSGDGSTVAYTRSVGDDGSAVYVEDLATGKEKQVDLEADGAKPAPSDVAVHGISDDGRYVLFDRGFDEDAEGIVKGCDAESETKRCVFRRDVDKGKTVAVNRDSAGELMPGPWYRDTVASLSDDGSRVAFASHGATEDSKYDEQAVVRDIDAGATTLISTNADGDPAESDGDTVQSAAWLSGDGELAVLRTNADNFGDEQGPWIKPSDLGIRQ